jgi:hypothetical protein
MVGVTLIITYYGAYVLFGFVIHLVSIRLTSLLAPHILPGHGRSHIKYSQTVSFTFPPNPSPALH